MNSKKIAALFKRELKDIFRDKKTLIMMIVVPLLLYPLMIIGMTFIMNAVNSSRLEKTYQIAYVDVDARTIAALSAIADDEERSDYKLETVECEDPQEALKREEIHAYVTRRQEDGQDQYEVHYLSASDDSSTAADAMMDVLYNYREDVRKERAELYQVDEKQILYPLTYELADVSSAEESVGNYLGRIIPFLVITSICLGAIYPSIDVTAGERERGTLETLLTLPVTNFEMIMSKFLAVSIIASISAVLNICSLGGAFIFMFAFIGGEAAGGLQMDIATFIPAILFMLLVVIFFALFVTAVSMCTCIFAKSFKEANNYITPILLVFMFGGYAPMLPDLELTGTTAAIPIINMTMMMKSLFNFEYNYGLYGIVLVSNVIYSVLTMMLLARLYNSESVLFAEGFTNIRIFTRRSEIKEGAPAGVGDVAFLLCLILLALFYIGSMATLNWGIYGVMVQQMLILLMPLVYAWYIKCDMKQVFSFRRPNMLSLVSALFLFAGAFVLNILLAYVLSFVFRESAGNVEETFAYLYEAPVFVIFFVTALLPAVGEELLFRGFTFSAIRQKCRMIPTILIVSALFGLYHMSVVKFFTTAFLGFFLALLVEKTGSIFPGMVFHFLNNAAADALSLYSAQISESFPILAAEKFDTGQIAAMAGIGGVCTAIGLFLLFRVRPRTKYAR